jgi:phosphatidylglycerophosphate synthase
VSLDGPKQPFSRREYTIVLTALLLLFCFRVLAQLIQAWYSVTFLPPFEAWESGALPYWLLVLSQTVVIVVCIRVIWRMHKGLTIPSSARGKVLLILGSVYFSLMCVRLIIGLTVATDHFWFGAKLPTAFHFVLAGFVLVYGRYHHTASGPVNQQSQGKTA